MSKKTILAAVKRYLPYIAIIPVLLAAGYILRTKYEDGYRAISEYNSAGSQADMQARITATAEANKIITNQLEAIDDRYIDKDIFLSELAEFAQVSAVEVIKFSEIFPEPVTEGEEEQPEGQTSALLSKTFSVTLRGDNYALHRAFAAIEELSGVNRVNSVMWLSDCMTGVGSDIEKGKSPLELLSQQKVTSLRSDTATLSFVIEYFTGEGKIGA